MVQRNICPRIIRTSSLALVCCLEYPQICFISASLSGSHWALRGPWLPQSHSAWVPREGTVFLPVRTLSLPVLLLPSTFSFPPSVRQSWMHPDSGSLARVQLPFTFCFESLVCQFPWMLLNFGKESDQIISLTGIFNPIFTGYYIINFNLYLSFCQGLTREKNFSRKKRLI